MFAIIKFGNKRYRIASEDVLKIEKISGEVGDVVEFVEVLQVGEGAKMTAGSPTADGAMVSAEIVDESRNRKIIAFKKRRRRNSHRSVKDRQHLATVRIAEILNAGEKPTSEKFAVETPLFIAPDDSADKLTDIKGIGPVTEKILNKQGITTFAQIRALNEDEISKIDKHIGLRARQIKFWQAQIEDKTLAEKVGKAQKSKELNLAKNENPEKVGIAKELKSEELIEIFAAEEGMNALFTENRLLDKINTFISSVYSQFELFAKQVGTAVLKHANIYIQNEPVSTSVILGILAGAITGSGLIMFLIASLVYFYGRMQNT